MSRPRVMQELVVTDLAEAEIAIKAHGSTELQGLMSDMFKASGQMTVRVVRHKRGSIDDWSMPNWIYEKERRGL